MPVVAERRPILTAAVGRRRPAVFGIVADGAERRRPSDLGRVGLATLLVVLTVASAEWLSPVEQWAQDLVDKLPGDLDPLYRACYPWAVVACAGAVVAAAVVSRRVRLGAAIALAGVGSAAVALALRQSVGTVVADSLAAGGVDVEGGSHVYPAVPLAVAVAMITASVPYVTRPLRRWMRLLVAVGCLAAVFSSQAIVLAVVAGLAIGWGTAAIVHLAMGSPAGTPSFADVTDSLRLLGVETRDLRLDPEQGWGEVRYLASDADGRPLRIAVIGRDSTDARLLAKAWRFVWYRDSGPPLTLTRAQQVEHRAFLLLLAGRADVDGPEVVAMGVAGESGSALLVTRDPLGPTLAELDAQLVTDDVLDAVWGTLDRLHAAQLAHGGLTASAVVVTPHGEAALVDLDRTTAAAPVDRQLQDDAQLLIATASIVGVPRALAGARRQLGRDGLVAVIPLLQPGVISRSARQQVDRPKELIAELREQAVALTGTESIEPAKLQRVSPTDLLMAVGTIIGIYLLIGPFADVAGVGDVFAGVIWGWVAVVALLSQLPQLAQAVGMLGSVSTRLPLGPATGVQFANQFTGMVAGTVGTTAVVIRFFQKQGLGPAVAVSSGVLNTLAAMAVEVVLVVTALIFTASNFTMPTDGSSSSDSSGSGTSTWVILAVIAIGVGLGALLVVPRLRRQVGARIRPQFVAARDNLRILAHSPRKAVELFGGNFASQVLFALTLEAALHAYGSSLPLLELILINSLASLLGGIVPVPGGLGVIEAGLIGGMTAAGVDETTAMAATFTSRLFTAYLPPIWGWFALRWLRQHDYV
ncbi:MAG: lysylphosphatidylglycerol synthase domain-containing protein [Acidimicrobiales bacterium]